MHNPVDPVNPVKINHIRDNSCYSWLERLGSGEGEEDEHCEVPDDVADHIDIDVLELPVHQTPEDTADQRGCKEHYIF